MRRILREIKARFQNAANCHFCAEADFDIDRQADDDWTPVNDTCHAPGCPWDQLMALKLEK